MKLTSNNKFLQELKLLFKAKNVYKSALFYGSNLKVFDAVVNNIDVIVDNGKVNLKDILIDDDLFERLRSLNGGSINEDGSIDEGFEDEIITLLKLSLEEESSVNVGSSPNESLSTDDFVDSKFVGDELLPDKKFDMTSLFYNLFKDKDINFRFNPSLKNISSNDKVTTKTFELIGDVISVMDVPVKYEIKCTAYNPKYNAVCNNLVKVSPIDAIHSAVKCRANHTIKNVEQATPSEVRRMFLYRAKEYSSSSEVILFSLNRFNSSKVVCNLVPVFDKNVSKNNYYVLGFQSVNPKKSLSEPILLKDEANYFFLNDIFESIKKYLKSNHREVVTNQNKVFALVMIFQYLSQRYLDTLYPALGIGKTRSGKSYFYHLLSTTLFLNSVKLDPTIRRNQFIGGQSGFSVNNNRLFIPGHVQSKDFIFIEEMAEKINSIHSNSNFAKLDVDNDLFNMFKRVYNFSDRLVNIGIQDSVDVKVNAVSFCTGNVESLTSVKQKYMKVFRSNYKKLGGDIGSLPSNTSPWKPLNYYKKFDDPLILKAHIITRNELDFFFMSGLDFPDQSRFAFFLAVDPYSKNYESKVKTRGSNLNFIRDKVHKEELNDELDDVFKGVFKKKHQKNMEKFLNDVYDWTEEFYNANKSQYHYENGEISGHIFDYLCESNRDFLLLQKTYYNQPFEFLEEDKQLLIYWNSFNYTMMDTDESAMVKQPDVLNPPYIDENKIFRDMDEVEQKIKDQQDELSIPFDDVADEIGDINDFEKLVIGGDDDIFK